MATKRFNYPSVCTLVKRIACNGNGNAPMYEMTCGVYQETSVQTKYYQTNVQTTYTISFNTKLCEKENRLTK